jgi:hypothetical protein
MADGFLRQLPYIVIGIIVFAVFVIAGRILQTIVHTAGRRTRLDLTLADLLGRIGSFAVIVLGFFVAAVIMFPAFQPGDLVAGSGSHLSQSVLPSRMYYKISSLAFLFSGVDLCSRRRN